MSEEHQEPESTKSGFWRAVARHPIMAVVMVGFIIGGAVTGYFLLSQDWSAFRRISGGAIGGSGVGFILTASRMIGAWKS